MDIDKLKLLASKVEEDCRPGVQIVAKALASGARDRGEFFPAHDVSKAMCGSLDAAKAVHEALLPGWFVGEMRQRSSRVWTVTVTRWDEEKQKRFYGIGENDDVARAWLLAILRGKITEAKR